MRSASWPSSIVSRAERADDLGAAPFIAKPKSARRIAKPTASTELRSLFWMPALSATVLGNIIDTVRHSGARLWKLLTINWFKVVSQLTERRPG